MVKLRIATCALLALLIPQTARAAGGFQSVEQGTWDMGRATVGAASAADSAATAFYNPAGMSWIDEPQVVVGLMGVLAESRFDIDPATTIAGSDGGNAFDNVVVPGGPFVVYPLDERWTLGFSVTAPFIGSIDYGRNFAGRYFLREFDIATYRAAPAVSYRVNDWLSLGEPNHSATP